MSDESKKDSDAIKLAIENQRNIDNVRENFESFYREEVKFQAEMKNQMNLVSEQQKSLRERFEIGTAGTLRELKEKFDEFLIDWGQKREQDKTRDGRLHRLEKHNEWIFRGVLIVVLAYLIINIFKFYAG